MNKLLFILFIVLSVVSSSMVSAEEYPYIYKGIRPMGMGGAFVAVSDDAHALFYNPAGLSYIQEKRISLLPIEAEISTGGYKAYKDALDVETANADESAAFLREYIGKYYHAAAAVFPHYERPHFAFGFFGTGKTNFIARNYQNPKLLVDSVGDAGVALGYAHSFLDDSISIGVSGKFVTRKSLSKEYSLPEITTDKFRDRLDEDALDGTGTLVDIGALYRFDEVTVGGNAVNFQAGMSANNLIGSEMGDAKDLPAHVDVGFAAKFDLLTLAFDYVDILGNLEEHNDLSKRLRVGAEYLILDKLIALRGGFYQGYPTLGISLNSRYAHLDLLTYAEEMGVYSGQQDNRRYTFRFVLAF